MPDPDSHMPTYDQLPEPKMWDINLTCYHTPELHSIRRGLQDTGSRKGGSDLLNG